MTTKYVKKMQRPKNVSLPLDENHRRWFYQELVVRFAEYKEPIRSIHQVAESFKLPWWEVAKIVEMDTNKTFLATDREHIWAVNRCEKLVQG